jgi:two-component system, chemotaxis family, protein-glutamate methylesterase/glutaminase
MIKVLIVEDSPVAQEFLSYILSSDAEIEVVGVSRNGAEAIEAVPRLRPAVITMDIHMPVMDGFEATRRIMETAPTPIVIVSGSTSSKEVASTFRAMEAGALAVVLRPPGMNHAAFGECSRELIQTVKLMSEIKVVRRVTRAAFEQGPASIGDERVPVAAAGISVVAIGASTGGPPALKTVLSGLPKDFRLPLLIVQHIAPGFTQGFAEWLSKASGIPVHIASDGETPLPGNAYLAPDGFHLGLGKGLIIALSSDPPENGGLRPSVSYLFRSVARVLGPFAVGILLTGMGRDGARELNDLRAMGALTIAQDEASSVVHGMPGEAIKLGAAIYVLPPEGIAKFLSALSNKTMEASQ